MGASLGKECYIFSNKQADTPLKKAGKLNAVWSNNLSPIILFSFRMYKQFLLLQVALKMYCQMMTTTIIFLLLSVIVPLFYQAVMPFLIFKIRLSSYFF